MKYHQNAQSYVNPNHLQLFKFCGFLIAKAIVQKENVDVNLTHAFLCRILGKEIKLNDIEEIDEDVFKSLHFILNNDLNLYEMYEEYFAVDHDNFGKIETYELIENGDQVRVTNENKLNYVKLMIDYYSKNSIDCQIQAFCEGFTSLIQQKYIKIFTPNELGLLISGVSLINVDILKENTIYEFPYTSNSPPVVLFFNSIFKWDQSDLKKLLMFITGSPNLPFTGLNIPIKIQCGGEKDRLPEAHTCFNTLCLPRYENEEQLNYKFMQAFTNESFLLI